MKFIQKWRRIALMVSLLLCIDVIVTLQLGRDVAVAQSLFALMIALLVAVNFLTIRMRK